MDRAVDVPFVAYTDPEYRLEMCRSRRHPRCDVSSDIDPGNIAILLAMAQTQRVNFPRGKSFKVRVLLPALPYKRLFADLFITKGFLIHPEKGGMSVVVLMADVTEQYLEGLRDLDRPFAALSEVRRAIVSFKDGVEKLLEVIKWIVESAPKIRKANEADKTKMSVCRPKQTQSVGTSDYVH